MSWNVVKELYSFVYERSGRGYVIQIGYWEIEGLKRKPILVKRRFKKGDSGYITWEQGAAGFEPEDVYRIFDNLRLISDLMEIPIPSDVGILKDELTNLDSTGGEQLELAPKP